MLPDSPWGHYAAGMVALARKDRQTARTELKEALACDSEHSPSKLALGRIAALEGRLAEAAVLLDDPGKSKDWYAFRTVGDTLVSQQRYRDAEIAYAQALELFVQPQRLAEEQKDWRALVAMGDTFIAGEFYADATAAYARAIEQMSKAKSVPPKVPIQVEKNLKDVRKAWEASRFDLEDKKGNARAWVKCEGFYESIKNLGAKDQAERIKAKLKDIHGGDVGFKYDIEDGVLVGVGRGRGQGKPARIAAYLQPLANLPLTRLSLPGTNVHDLSPLRGMSLKELICGATRVTNLNQLKGMPLTSLSIQGTTISDLRPLEGMSLKHLNCIGSKVIDLSPLKGMPLISLRLHGTGVKDLRPLKGMPLTSLDCSFTSVIDLGPLKGMPLTSLECVGVRVTDLASLKGMKLTNLNLLACRSVTSLNGIEGMPLTTLDIRGCRALQGDLSALKGMKLTSLNLEGCFSLTSLKGIEGIPLKSLVITGAKVTDLTPLKGMKLRKFSFTPKNITSGIKIIRGMKTIDEISQSQHHEADKRGTMKPAEFWKKYDAGEFNE